MSSCAQSQEHAFENQLKKAMAVDGLTRLSEKVSCKQAADSGWIVTLRHPWVGLMKLKVSVPQHVNPLSAEAFQKLYDNIFHHILTNV